MRRILFVVFGTVLYASVSRAQNPTDPPAGQHALVTMVGRGVQIYVCQLANGTPQWVFQAPEATLYDLNGVKVGSHGAGPVWSHKDGSTVKGELLQKAAAPDPGAIPWLLLRAVGPTGDGTLSRAEFIRRSDTHGGVASSTGCDAQHLNQISRIPYSATYTFYSSNR